MQQIRQKARVEITSMWERLFYPIPLEKKPEIFFSIKNHAATYQPNIFLDFFFLNFT